MVTEDKHESGLAVWNADQSGRKVCENSIYFEFGRKQFIRLYECVWNKYSWFVILKLRHKIFINYLHFFC
jgi:hypothetical protein